jgi:uncharacterized BrkB/YihY/UPF0761 family membrane protein
MSSSAPPAEDRKSYLDRSELSIFEYLGMLAGLVLFVSLWLPWFTTGPNPDSRINAVGPDSSANAWETFGILPWLFLALSAAPFILAWIVARRHKLDWPTGEVTMVTGLIGVVLVLCNGFILGKPGSDIQISIAIGWWLGLLACLGIFGSGLMRQAEKTSGRPRKPPGVI